MSPSMNLNTRPPVGSLLSDPSETAGRSVADLAARSTENAKSQSLSENTLPSDIEPKTTRAQQTATPKMGFLASAMTCLNLVRCERPKAFYAKCRLSLAETTYQAVPVLLVAPFAQALARQDIVTGVILGAALAACWKIREWVVSRRDYINENFFRKTWRVVENHFLKQHLSRSLETIRSSEYSDKVTKVREQGQRLASFSQRLFDLSTNVINVTIAAAGLAAYNPLAAVAILSVGALALSNYVRYARDFNKTEDSVAEARRGYWHRRSFVSSTQPVREVKLLGKEAQAIESVNEADMQLATPRLEDTLRLTSRNQISGALSFAANVSIVGAAAIYTYLGELASESLMQIISMTLYSGMQLALMSKSISDMLQDFVVVREALAIDQQGEPERIAGKVYQRLTPGKAPLIELKDVTYAPEGSPAIIENLSLVLEPGKVYGLCGESGAGKTTLMRLLMREISPTSGDILLDGMSISEIDPEDIKAATRYLAQDYVDFESYSVRKAVSMGLRPGTEDEEAAIEAALEKAAVDFISMDDIDTIIGVDFSNARDFSGGERQRLAIARTLIGESSLLVLDEPTSRIDHDHADHIFAHLLAKDPEHPRTVIIISHRYANLRETDYTFFLKKGVGVSEQGSHEELVALDGDYARLFRREQQGLE